MPCISCAARAAMIGQAGRRIAAGQGRAAIDVLRPLPATFVADGKAIADAVKTAAAATLARISR